MAATRAVTLQSGANTGNRLINNTILNATTLLYLDAGASANTFYWNNFAATTGAYIQDLNGTNFYNATYDGKNQGNAYANVLNGSITVVGSTVSSIPNYYLGVSGAGVPYNNSTSGSKFVCSFARCGDYAPLNIARITLNSTTGGAVAANTSGFDLTVAQSINATPTGASTFVNWTITSGNCTIDNVSNNATNVTSLDTSVCYVQGNFLSGSSCAYSGTGNWTIQLADNCNITSSTNLGANWLIYNGTGTVTYTNATNQIVMSALGEKLTNVAGTFYEYVKSMLWKNYTG